MFSSPNISKWKSKTFITFNCALYAGHNLDSRRKKKDLQLKQRFTIEKINLSI